jgi:hypothetical protein
MGIDIDITVSAYEIILLRIEDELGPTIFLFNSKTKNKKNKKKKKKKKKERKNELFKALSIQLVTPIIESIIQLPAHPVMEHPP